MAPVSQRLPRESSKSHFLSITKGSRPIGLLTKAGSKYILIYSDLKEELPAGYKRDFDLSLDGYTVLALNVTKLRPDNIDPVEYLQRVESWEQKVTVGGGNWYIVNDIEKDGALDLANY